MVIRVNIFKRYSLTLSDDVIANGKSSDTKNVTSYKARDFYHYLTHNIFHESPLNQVTKSLSDLTRNDVLPGAFPTGYKMEF